MRGGGGGRFLYLTRELSYCTCAGPYRSLCDYAHVGILCTFSCWICREFAAEQLLCKAGGTVRHMAGGTASPSQYKSSFPLPSPPASQGRTTCRVNSLRPSASVYLTHSGEYSDGGALVVGCDQRVVAQSEHKSLSETQAD